MQPEIENYAAYRDGWRAHRNGVANTDEQNPYCERRQNYSYEAWLTGWSARFNWLKHGGDDDDAPFNPHEL